MCYARDSNLLLNNTASIYVYKGERHTDTSVWWGDPRVKIRNLWLKEGSQGKKVFRWLFFFLGEFSLFSGGLAPNGTTTTTTRNRSTLLCKINASILNLSIHNNTFWLPKNEQYYNNKQSSFNIDHTILHTGFWNCPYTAADATANYQMMFPKVMGGEPLSAPCLKPK